MDEIEHALKLLKNGEVVAIPTETVYGLAARIDSDSAIEKIFKTKQRPFFDPLIVHVSSIDQAQQLTTDWNAIADALAKEFWPGPLTMVLPKSAQISDVITSGLTSVGIRMPEHPMALELIHQAGVPLAAPSANKFGKTSPTSANHVRSEFHQENVFVVDGGECQIGIESTVLMIKGEEISILRHGMIHRHEIEHFLRQSKIKFKYIEQVSKKESPGHMKHHYMPTIPLILVKGEFEHSEFLHRINTDFKKIPDEIESVQIIKPTTQIHQLAHLELTKDPATAARKLYSELRKQAESGAEAIYFQIERIHQQPEWSGIMDRLTKAASLEYNFEPKYHVQGFGHVRSAYRMILFLFILVAFFTHTGLIAIVNRNQKNQRLKAARAIRFWTDFCLKVFSVNVELINYQIPDGPFLLVANHMGFIDILLSSSLTPMNYITSIEMKNTPVLGWISQLGGCFYVERRNRSNIYGELQNIVEALKSGFRIGLFPEAQATNGEQVIPFKRTLIMAAPLAGVPIQPVVVNFEKLAGEPFTLKNRDAVCWHDDTNFIVSLWRAFSLKDIHATVEFLPPVLIDANEDKAVVADRVYKMVADKFKPCV